MVVSIVIPVPGGDPTSAKDAVFSALTKSQPLSLAQLTRAIRTSYRISITYQGVRKAVASLLDDGVLEKNDKTYRINRSWVSYARSYLERLERAEPETTSTATGKQFGEYSFTSLYELDAFWGTVLESWARKAPASEELVADVGHAWWMILNLGKETRINRTIMASGKRFLYCHKYVTATDRKIAQINRKLGVRVKQSMRKDAMDTNIYGDHILRVAYPKELQQKIHHIFTQARDMHAIDMLAFAAVCHEHHDITVSVLHDAVLADALRREIKTGSR
jgi:hypothetical protein